MLHLWNINNQVVEDVNPYTYSFDNWDAFIVSDIWNRNVIYGCISAYWVWIDAEDEEYEDWSLEGDELTLVYLSLAPCSARVIRINVDKKDEVNIEKWLMENEFLKMGG